jgi:hypothetical protein
MQSNALAFSGALDLKRDEYILLSNDSSKCLGMEARFRYREIAIWEVLAMWRTLPDCGQNGILRG